MSIWKPSQGTWRGRYAKPDPRSKMLDRKCLKYSLAASEATGEDKIIYEALYEYSDAIRKRRNRPGRVCCFFP